MPWSRRVLLSIALIFATAHPSRAEVGVIVLEPIRALGFFTRVGHAGTYFSNICPDGSPVRMRLCRPGERGGVVSKYAPLSEHEDYDWAIVPFDEYLHGFASSDIAPLIGTKKLQAAIERFNFGPLFSSALTRNADGALPEGQWKTALATRFDRSLYLFSVETTAADDALLVSAFNAAPNRSQFNFFYRNCSNQAKLILDLILPRVKAVGDRTGGLTMETPKGLAKALVERAIENPGLHLRVRRYGQLPGTFARSQPVLFPMENTYRSLGFAPWWVFGGFREVALGAMLYHEVVSPFRVTETFRDFISPTAARLTLEQHGLRQRQDDVHRALASPSRSRGVRLQRLLEADAAVFQRLGAIKREKRDELERILGSPAVQESLAMTFRSRVRELARRLPVPGALDERLAGFEPDGTLSSHLINYLEERGHFYVDERGRGPWIRVSLADGETRATGLSRSHVLDGDPRVSVLVLIAVIDYYMHQSDDRREDLDDVTALLSMLQRAAETIATDR